MPDTLPRLSELQSAPEWKVMDFDERLSIYDQWQSDVKAKAEDDGLEGADRDMLDSWLENQRGYIEIEKATADPEGAILDSVSRGLLNTESALRVQQAKQEVDQMEATSTMLNSVKFKVRPGEAIYEGRPDLLPEGTPARLLFGSSEAGVYAVPPDTPKTSSPEEFISNQKEAYHERAQKLKDATAQAVEAGDLAASLPTAKPVREFMEADGFSESAGELFRNFLPIAAHTLAESAPSIVAPVAGAAIGGAKAGVVGSAAGGAAGGFSMEYVNSYRDFLEEAATEAGIDANTPEGLVEALRTPEITEIAKERAVQRGVPIAAVDAMTVGIGGLLAKKFGTRAAMNLTVDPAGGAVGELAAQAASGQEMSGKEAVLEGIGQAATGASTTAVDAVQSAVDARSGSESAVEASEGDSGIVQANMQEAQQEATQEQSREFPENAALPERENVVVQENVQEMPDSSQQVVQDSTSGQGEGDNGGFEINDYKQGIIANPEENAVFSTVKSKFRSRGDLPEGAFEAKNRSQALQNKIRRESDHNLERLDNAIRKEVGAAVTPARKQQKQALMQQVQQVMVGEQDIAALPANLQTPVRDMRNHVDRLSEQLVHEGVVQGDMVEVVQANQGTYLNRSYRVFDDPAWAEKVPADVKNRAIGLLRRQLPQREGESDVDYQSRINGQITELLYNRVDSPIALLAKGSLGSKDLKNLIGRKEIPEEIRALWGEYSQGNENYARSVFKMANQIANHRFLNDVRQDGMGQYLFEEPRGDFGVQIAADGSKAMEPLNGLYTTKAIADSFSSVNGDDLGSLGKLAMTFNGAVKYGKTVLNPITHVRNFLSNPIIMVGNGHFDLGAMSKGQPMRVLAADLLSGSFLDAAEKSGGFRAKDFREQYRRYVELGILEDGVAGEELHAVLKDSLVGDVDMAQFSENRLRRAAGKVNKVPQKLYQAEDGYWKILAFESERKRYAKAYPALTDAELDAKAADIVRDTMPTYSLVPEAVQKIRRFPLAGTFVSFPAEIFRTNWNIAKLARSEMQSPETRAIGAKRMAGLATAHAMPLATVAMFKMLAGISDEDEEAVRELAAPWDKNSQLLFLGRTEKGEPRYVNISYSDPYSMFKSPPLAMMNALKEGESMENAFAQFMADLAGPFTQEEIGASVLLDVSRNATKDGVSIYNEADTDAAKLRQIAEHVYETARPGFLASAERISKAATGEKSRSGRSYSLDDEMTALISGQRRVTLSPENAIMYRAGDFQRSRADTTRIISSVLGDQGTVTDGDIQEAYTRAQEQKDRQLANFRRAYNAALRFSDMDNINKAARAGGLGKGALEIVQNANAQDNVEISKTLAKRIEAIPGRREQVVRVLGSSVFAD